MLEPQDKWVCQLVEPKHPALHKPADIDPFTAPDDANWAQREVDMFKLMHDRYGIGLASPQIGNSYNMFVMNMKGSGDVGVYNPKILEFSEEEVLMEEGCLTFPLLYLHVTRPEKVKVSYTLYDGKTEVEGWLDGIDSRCFQHEFEHLQGKLFLDNVSDFKLQRAKKKRDKYLKEIQRKVKV
jgi:peptide deformylase